MTHQCDLMKKPSLLHLFYNAGVLKNLKRKCQAIILVSPSNPRCSRYFRSEAAILEEKKRQLFSSYRFMIHPLSTFRAWYELYLCLLYVIVLTTKPLDAGFVRRQTDIFPYYKKINVLFDVLCWIDIIMNFFTGYIKRKRAIELKPSKVAKHYLKSVFFFCDVISSYPRGLPYLIKERPNKIFLGIVNIIGLFKIVRLVTLMQLIQRVAQYFVIKDTRSIVLFCSCLFSILIVHWMACLQFAVPRLVGRYFVKKPVLDSWVYSNHIYEKPFLQKYAHCLFRSSAYILGTRIIGFYELKAEDCVLAVFTYVIGKVLMASVWVILAIAILNARSMDLKFYEIINQLDEYMRQKQLPFNLRKRILQFYDYKYQKKYQNEDYITSLLSDSLQNKVNIHVCRSLIASVPVLSDLTPKQISKVVSKLKPEIYLPGDTILQSGTPGDAMYFISSGTVALYTHSGKEVCHLQDGAYFGEVALVMKNQTTIATIIAIEITQVYKLGKRDFNKILTKNRMVYKRILLEAEHLLQKITEMEKTYKMMLFEKTYRKGEIVEG